MEYQKSVTYNHFCFNIYISFTYFVLYLYLADGLETNTTLKKLKLNSNPIGDKGGQSIINSLKINKTLSYLSIAGTNIEEKLKHILDQSIHTQVNSSFIY